MSEWNIIMVYSKSQTNTRPSCLSGCDREGLFFRPCPPQDRQELALTSTTAGHPGPEQPIKIISRYKQRTKVASP